MASWSRVQPAPHERQTLHAFAHARDDPPLAVFAQQLLRDREAGGINVVAPLLHGLAETCCPSIKKNHRLFKQNPKKRRVRFDLSAAEHVTCGLQKACKTDQEKESKDHDLHGILSSEE
jgi:hypothetical protein